MGGLLKTDPHRHFVGDMPLVKQFGTMHRLLFDGTDKERSDRNSEHFVWRQGALLDMYLPAGEQHPHILVNDVTCKKSLCADGKPRSDLKHVHPTYQSKSKLVTILHARHATCPNIEEKDLMNLPNPNTLEVALCLSERLIKLKRQYTWLEDTMVSINPFQKLPYNEPKHIQSYIEAKGGDSSKKMAPDFGLDPGEPHVWDTILNAFQDMQTKNRSQSIIGRRWVLRSGPMSACPCPEPVVQESRSMSCPCYDSF